MSEYDYDKNYGPWLSAAGITPPGDPTSLRGVIHTILLNLNSVGVTGLLARTSYAPATVHTGTIIVSSTGLTAVNFATGGDQSVTFTAPASGNALVRLSAFVKGGAAAASSTVFGLTSNGHASSPGTVVGVTGLALLTPTATAADNGVHCSVPILVTGLTAATAYTLYFAASYSGTATTLLAQGPTAATTVPTGAPLVMEVWAA